MLTDPDNNHNLNQAQFHAPATMTTQVSSGKVQHICPLCGKDMKQKNDLRRHLRVHSGERPYVCQYCQRGFTRKDSLNNHVFCVHKENP